MAELTEVHIKDFRAFRTASIAMSPDGLVLVAGPNNAGKSALLSAFDVIAKTDVSVSRRHVAGEKIGIFARWRLNESERLTLLGEAQQTGDLVREGAASWLEWEFSEFQDRIQPVAASVHWPKIDKLEFARIAGSASGQWQISTANQSLATWSQAYSVRAQLPGGRVEDTLGFVPRDTESIYLAVEILAQWRQGYYHFQPLREAQGRQAPLSNISPILDKSGANLATVLLYLHTNEPSLWTQLVSLVRQIVPGVGELMIPVRGNTCSIVFQDDNVITHQHNLKDLGTGVEQLLMTLVVGLTQTATTVVLEEPETGLHPGAQRALLGLLQDWSKKRLFVASTHSATMLDWRSPTTSVYAVSRNDTESTVVPVTSDRAAVLQELGVRLSDLLSAERIMVLEGPTDRDIFEVWFPDVVRNPTVAVLPGHGGYNAQHADLFAEWLDTADELGHRRILYIRDRDELSARYLQRLTASPNVYVLPGRELENLMLDFEAIAKVVNAELTKAGKPSATAGDIAVAAKELAGELRLNVVLKRTMGDLADPIRLVDNELRRRLNKANADEETLTKEVLARMPEKATVQSDISVSWQRHTREVDATWEADWRNGVPGADLLSSVWKKYLDRGYSKSVDGLAIETAMNAPPGALVDVVANFTQP